MSERDQSDKDVLFEILSSARRRRLLYHLHRRGGEADLRELARDVAADETGTPVGEDVEKRLYISLYQTHVPKLEEAGLVVYDADERRVSLTERIDALREVMDGDRSNRRWIRPYALLAAFGVILASLSMLSLAPVDASWIAAIIATLLVVLTIVQYYNVVFRSSSGDFAEVLVE